MFTINPSQITTS